AAGVYGREAEGLVGAELSSIIHPDDLGRVVHEVRRFLAAPPHEEPTTRIECRFRSGTGDWLNVESTVNRHQGGLLLNSRDVTERVRLQAQLQHNAEHDPLTDLPNRALFTAGDELLIQAGRRLQDSVRAGDTAARLGGDEFAALIMGDGTRDQGAREYQVHEIADRLRLTLSQPYRIGASEVRVAASIGVAFAEPAISPTDLMRNADLAMYRAKAGGKDRVELYAPQMQADVVRRSELADRLRTAELGRWLLEEAVAQAADRARAGHPVAVSVRLSAARLLDAAPPPGSIEALLTRHGLPSGALMIEVADSDPRVSFDALEQRLVALRRLGVRIALDGFGSGFAAINALRRLPIDVLKLDRNLVEGVVESARLHKITSGLLRIACDLGLQSVADGVDVPEQVLALRAMGCTHGQGMAFSGPLDEYRLRRALVRGEFPVPGIPSPRPVLAGGSIPLLTGSHAETPVPPT
ncbi:bifunctional diguanylate cyclase/phosphodiesterase, partial [Streptomyces sp. MBT55]|uniref:bifunctional diguanylate cyclase/phosphodiesterase n=1 Tax=Streptomyces sp. MBT55 TaxID=1488386 RepID=UPI001914CAFF